jgi:hypothetical protein
MKIIDESSLNVRKERKPLLFIRIMTNVYKIENLENLLQCAICLDRFRTPKVLSCQHTFCLICLQGYFII